MIQQLSFEQGPIRPPNEAKSLLLRITRNCPWNQCMFCPVYKGRKFSLREVQEIKDDIKTAREIYDSIKEVSFRLGYGGHANSQVISTVLNDPGRSESFRSMAMWMYYGTSACFLQDADNLIMKTDDLVEVLEYLRVNFPEITRITTYSRSRTIAKKSEEELVRIRKAGLNRIHVGLETGYDPLLKLIKKGVTSEQQIDAGKKVIAAGMELSEYVMPGLGGQTMWKEHAEATAKVLNQINPHFIRLRSLRIPERVPLIEKVRSGEFKKQTDDGIAEEIRLFIETLDNITSTLTSDHIMNLLEEVNGTFPQDKEKMLGVIKIYQDMPDNERMVYRVGRRGGAYRSTTEVYNDPVTRNRIENMISEIRRQGGESGLEQAISDMVDQYI
ncbi:MAG: radical SAM protein [Desulfatiglans sp.]|jgi:histone acetyltransferase (RNA polymerase elongator complex component)|nr:radical SAM protein [Desulfatiglans sp.]